MNVEENKRLMQTLDDAWNGQDWDTFNKRHAENVDVFRREESRLWVRRIVHPSQSAPDDLLAQQL